MQTQGFADSILQHFPRRVKFESLHLRHTKPLKPQWFQGFQAKSHGCFPLCFPFSEIQHVFDEGVHPGGTGLLHLIGDVAVDVQGKGCCDVAQVALDRLDVITTSDSSDGIGMSKLVEAKNEAILVEVENRT